MTSTAQNDRFIPLPLTRVIADARRSLPEDRQSSFESFTKLLVALLRYEIGTELDELKTIYEPFNPDRDTVVDAAAPEGSEQGLASLHARVQALLERANFVELSRADLDAALTKTSPLGLAVSVDLDSFDDFSVFYRGRGETVEWRRTWKSRFQKAPVRAPVYRRVFLLIKARPDASGASSGPERELGELDPRHVVLKLFKDIPHSDLEMLLPNTRVRMTGLDKARLGITGGGGTIGGVMATVTKLGAAASPTTWAIALGGLGAVLWRQLSKVFSQRTKYMATLAQRLYFHTLDNGFGVVTRLVEMAEAEESKEALLAAAILTSDGEQTAEELDRRAESWTHETYGVSTDYDVRGGLGKLRDAGLLVEKGGRVALLPLEEAFARLDETWDDIFTAEGGAGREADSGAGEALESPAV